MKEQDQTYLLPTNRADAFVEALNRLLIVRNDPATAHYAEGIDALTYAAEAADIDSWECLPERDEPFWVVDGFIVMFTPNGAKREGLYEDLLLKREGIDQDIMAAICVAGLETQDQGGAA